MPKRPKRGYDVQYGGNEIQTLRTLPILLQAIVFSLNLMSEGVVSGDGGASGACV